MVLSDWKFGTFFSVNFSWGTGVMLGCYWGGGVSGEYLAVIRPVAGYTDTLDKHTRCLLLGFRRYAEVLLGERSVE